MRAFTVNCFGILLLLTTPCFIDASTRVCPGAPQANYKPGAISCGIPNWSLSCYQLHQYQPSANPTKYFQCTSVAVLERSCAPGTCFQPALRRCTFAASWINECLENGPTTEAPTTTTTIRTTEISSTTTTASPTETPSTKTPSPTTTTTTEIPIESTTIRDQDSGVLLENEDYLYIYENAKDHAKAY